MASKEEETALSRGLRSTSWFQEHGEWVTAVFLVMASVLTYLPLYLSTGSVAEGMSFGSNVSTDLFVNSCVYRFAITFIELLDLSFDGGAGLLTTLFQKKQPASTVAKKNQPPSALRLHHYERFFFLIGVASISVGMFNGPRGAADYSFAVFACTMNLTAVLTVSPLLLFARRCSLTWTTPAVAVAVASLVIGKVLGSISYIFPAGSANNVSVGVAGGVLTAVSAAVVAAVAAVSAAKSVWMLYQRRNTVAAAAPQALAQEHGSSPSDLQLFVASANTGALLVLVAIHTLWSFYPSPDGVYTGCVNFVHMAVGVFILTVEIRVRNTEMARGLVAIIEARKAYVRYISHELRTPLNAAFLGLKCVIDGLDGCTEAADVEVRRGSRSTHTICTLY
jgi:hypothetical protein